MKEIAKRTFEATDLKIETKADSDMPVIRGHAAVFDIISEMAGWYRERVARGAFTDSIKQDDIRALWNHDSNFVLGRNKVGTLKLSEDNRGLAVEIHPPDTSISRDFIELIRRGDVSQMSFGFEVLKQSWEVEKDELDLRTIEKVKLWEVSPVTFPFYEDTDISVKASHAEWRSSFKSPEYKHPKKYSYWNFRKTEFLKKFNLKKEIKNE